jgi:hypothetical protein
MTANKPEIVRPLTFEEMTEALRAYYDPTRRRRHQVPEAIHEYHPLNAYDDEVEPFHRIKR